MTFNPLLNVDITSGIPSFSITNILSVLLWVVERIAKFLVIIYCNINNIIFNYKIFIYPHYF